MGKSKGRISRSAQRVVIPYDRLGFQKELASEIARGAKVILVLAGIRSGKTYGGIMECLDQIYKYKKRPNLGWIISPTYPMSLIPERLFRKACSTETGTLIAYERRGERAFYMKAPPGEKELFRVEFKSADEPDRLRGASIAWALLDEGAMMRPETYTIIQGRVLDSNGVIIITTTPRGKNWIYHDIYLKWLDGDPKYSVIKAKTIDNSYLDPLEVEKLYADYASKSDILAKQELEGEFQDFIGKVFTAFGTENVVKPQEVPETAQVVCGIDWGFNDPFVCVWCVQWEGVWYVVDEYYKSRTLLKDHAQYIQSHPLFPRVKRVWCDPSSPQNRREFTALGFRNIFPARRPDKSHKVTGWPEMRARCLNRLLGQRTKDPFDAKKLAPTLRFYNHCVKTQQEIDTLCYERIMSAAEDKQGRVVVRVMDKEGHEVDRNAGEKIVDKDNHCVDALGYALFSEERLFGKTYGHYFDEDKGQIVSQKPSPSEIYDAWFDMRVDVGAKNREKDKIHGTNSEL